MYGINVGKYTIHGSYGVCNPLTKKMTPNTPRSETAAFNVKILKCFSASQVLKHSSLSHRYRSPPTPCPGPAEDLFANRTRCYSSGENGGLEPEITLEKEKHWPKPPVLGGFQTLLFGGSPRWSFFGGNLGLFWRLNSLLVLGSVLLPSQKIRKIRTKVNQATSVWNINHLWFFDGIFWVGLTESAKNIHWGQKEKPEADIGMEENEGSSLVSWTKRMWGYLFGYL